VKRERNLTKVNVQKMEFNSIRNIFLLFLLAITLSISQSIPHETERLSGITKLIVSSYIVTMSHPTFLSMKSIDQLNVLNLFRTLIKRHLEHLNKYLYLNSIKLKAGKLNINGK